MEIRGKQAKKGRQAKIRKNRRKEERIGDKKMKPCGKNKETWKNNDTG